MARLFGYMGNRVDLIHCGIFAESEGLNLAPGTHVDGWGVGFYQGGEVLIRKRPNDSRANVPAADRVKGLRTDCAVVHLRAASHGDLSMENTHPFRHRQWMFGHNGMIEAFETLGPKWTAALPEFLRTSIMGQTDSEVIFNGFLASVHRTGRLHDPDLDRRTLLDCLRETVAQIDTLSAGLRVARPVLNLIVTNHNTTIALRRGLPMAFVRRQGIRNCTACRADNDRKDGSHTWGVDHNTFRYVLIASDHPTVPAGWQEVPESPNGSVITVDRNLDVHMLEL